MSEQLHTCPTCLTPNFTPAGLRSHRCKGVQRSSNPQSAISNPQSGDVSIADPWDRPRSILEGIKLAVRLSLAGQIILGHELANLKKDMGFTHGSAKRFSPSGQNVQMEKTWPQLIEENLKISYKTADRMIACFEAAKVRVKKLGHLGTLPDGTKRLELLFTAKPSGMVDADREALAKAVDKLVDGDSQVDLLRELKLIKAPVALKGGDTSGHRKPPTEDETIAQLSFNFCAPVFNESRRMLSMPELPTMLRALPLEGDDDDSMSLASLEKSTRMLLQEIEEAKTDKVREMKSARH